MVVIVAGQDTVQDITLCSQSGTATTPPCPAADGVAH
jgi:hypothetical protein